MQIEIESLPVKNIVDIFSRLSLKDLGRMKCVSKPWCSIITNVRRTVQRTTSIGLVILTYPWPSKDIHGRTSASLLPVQDQGRNSTIQFSYPLNIQKPSLLDSCNGLLLCGSNSDRNFDANLYVICPMLHQFRTLPFLGFKRHELSFARIILCGPQENFKVISRFGDIDSSSETIKFHIFESEKWEWKEQNAKVVPISPFVCDPNEEIYLIRGGCMLIYNFQKGFLKFAQLPDKKQTSTEYKLLWVSEGSLYYCTSYKNDVLKFRIWRYEGDNQANMNGDYRINNKWRLTKLSFPRDDDKLKIKRMNLADYDVQVLAFNDDLQILYLGLWELNILVAYSFESRKLSKILGVPFTSNTLKQHENSNYYCWRDSCLAFMFNPVNIPNAE